LGTLVEPLQTGLDVSVDTGVPDPDRFPSRWAAGLLAWSEAWGWTAAAAALAGAAALAVAAPRRRWAVLALGGISAVLIGFGVAGWAARLGGQGTGAAAAAADRSLVQLVIDRLLEGAGAQAAGLAGWMTGIGAAIVIVAAVTGVVGRSRRTR
jgi:hypothetical protein